MVDQDNDGRQSKAGSDADEDGWLDAFAHAKEEANKPYQKRNLIATGYTQLIQGRLDTTKRPLAAVKDFLSQWLYGNVSPVDFLDVGTKAMDLTEGQQRSLKLFIKAARQWAPVIERNLARPVKSTTQKTDPEDFYFKDMMQFLIQSVNREGKPVLTLEENIRTAMVYAAFSWVAENAYRDMYNSDGAINFALGREQDVKVTHKLRCLMAPIGIRQNVVFNSLGQRVLASLGLEPKRDLPLSDTPRLESALGAHVAKLLVDEGILIRTPVPGKVMAERMGNLSTRQEATHYFLKLWRDDKGNLCPKASQIHESTKGTHNILDRLFQVEPAVKRPSFTPILFKQVLAKNSIQLVPNNLAKILDAKNAEANYLRKDMWALMTQLDKLLILEISGGELVDEFTHRLNLIRKTVQNDSLIGEHQRLMDYVQDTLLPPNNGLEKPFYFEHVVWKQQGVGIATNLINPQISKIHRFMLCRKDWKSIIQMSNKEQMENFKLRVIEGLGGKTKKQTNADTLTEYDYIFNPTKTGSDKKLGAEVLARTIDALQAVIRGETLNLRQQCDIAMGVKGGGEKFKSLDALMAIAHYRTAEAAGSPEFTVNMMGEIDGVANGPMLGYLLLGASSADEMLSLLIRVGFCKVGDEDDQYSHNKSPPDCQDLYEITIAGALQRARRSARLNRQVIPLFESIFAFIGDLTDKEGAILKAGRDVIKTPLISFVFGSSLLKSVDVMADELIEAIYKKFEEVARERKSLVPLIRQLNILIGDNVQKWEPNLTIEQVFEKFLTDEQIAAIKKSFGQTMGQAVSDTLKDVFETHIERRGQFNKTADLAYQLHNAAYQGLRERRIAELVQSGEVACRVNRNGEWVPVHDLSAVQEGELRKQLGTATPVMHTLMSIESGCLDAGLEIGKSARKLSQNQQYQSVVLLRNGLDGKPMRTHINGYELVRSDPGVAMFPLCIQSTESAISHYAAAQGNVLSIHDAHWTGLANFIQTARNLNQATWYAMLNYSPATEMYAALERTICGLVRALEGQDIPYSARHRLKESLQQEMLERGSYDLGAYLQSALRDAKHTAYMADKMKLETLSRLQSVNQYAIEGGSFHVAETDRAEAQMKLNEISCEVPVIQLERAARLGDLMAS
jgi:hypothetical protein